MTSDDRTRESNQRIGERCPICDGPTYLKAGEARCRNSLCVFNHRSAICPRCSVQNIKSVWFADGLYHYSCAGCLNSWTAE
jgi:hypothetical protein